MYNYFKQKELNKQHAKAWTAEMANRFPNQIEESVNNSKIFENCVISQVDYINSPIVSVIDATTDQAIFNCKMEPSNHVQKVVALNFASYKHPGGMFMKGSSAQEESLCHKSFLYNVLSHEKLSGYYEWNNHNLNKGMYTNRAIYTPDVIFCDTINGKEYNVLCDILTCAAPNASVLKRFGSFTSEENSIALYERIKFVMNILSIQAPDVTILGAFGCGVFRQDPYEVAKCFKEFLSLLSGTVIFAIPTFHNSTNYNAFKEVLEG